MAPTKQIEKVQVGPPQRCFPQHNGTKTLEAYLAAAASRKCFAAQNSERNKVPILLKKVQNERLCAFEIESSILFLTDFMLSLGFHKCSHRVLKKRSC